MDNFFYLLIFVLVGNALMYAYEFSKKKTWPHWSDYIFNVGAGATLAYFIDVKEVQALIMLLVAVGFARVLVAVRKIARSEQS